MSELQEELAAEKVAALKLRTEVCVIRFINNDSTQYYRNASQDEIKHFTLTSKRHLLFYCWTIYLQNAELTHDARSARAYRDELDVWKDKVIFI
jgi:hypothetical protein